VAVPRGSSSGAASRRSTEVFLNQRSRIGVASRLMSTEWRSRDFDTAEAFLAVLNPGGAGLRDIKCAFRGQSDALWGLVPSVLRRGPDGKAPWEKRAADVPDDAPLGADNVARRQGEANLILDFRDRVDRVGLPIPEDSASLHSWRELQQIIAE
jgi:hypothetical protein